MSLQLEALLNDLGPVSATQLVHWSEDSVSVRERESVVKDLKKAGVYDLARRIRSAIVLPDRVLVYIDLEAGAGLTSIPRPAAVAA